MILICSVCVCVCQSQLVSHTVFTVYLFFIICVIRHLISRDLITHNNIKSMLCQCHVCCAFLHVSL